MMTGDRKHHIHQAPFYYTEYTGAGAGQVVDCVEGSTIRGGKIPQRPELVEPPHFRNYMKRQV